MLNGQDLMARYGIVYARLLNSYCLIPGSLLSVA